MHAKSKLDHSDQDSRCHTLEKRSQMGGRLRCFEEGGILEGGNPALGTKRAPKEDRAARADGRKVKGMVVQRNLLQYNPQKGILTVFDMALPRKGNHNSGKQGKGKNEKKSIGQRGSLDSAIKKNLQQGPIALGRFGGDLT